jgi:hypothetical protein
MSRAYYLGTLNSLSMSRGVGGQAALFSAALVAAGLVLGGCGGGSQHESVPSLAAVPHSKPADQPGKPNGPKAQPIRAKRAAKPARQLLFAVPKTGRLSGDCRGEKKFLLTYTAVRDIGQTVVVRVGGMVVAQQRIAPGHSIGFSVKIHPRKQGSGTVYESPAIKLTARVIRKPYDARSVTRFRLADAADQSGECVAESAAVKVVTHFHYA